jgi:hypothetical protein
MLLRLPESASSSASAAYSSSVKMSPPGVLRLLELDADARREGQDLEDSPHRPRAFRAYGENVVLGQVAHSFGVKGVETLLKDDAVEFVLWDQEVGYLVNEEPRRNGVHPLASNEVHSSNGRDPAPPNVEPPRSLQQA